MAIILIILGLSLLILVHEWGHFFAARRSGVKVEEFGIGFPPTLWSRTKKGTLYSVNSIPFGGFVKLYGEEGIQEGEAKEESFVAQSLFKKICIVLAGVFMNVVAGWFLLSIVLMIGAPHHVVVSGVAEGSPAAHGGIKTNDVIVSAESELQKIENPENTKAFVDLVEKSVIKKMRVVIEREGKTIPLTLEGRINPPPGEGALGVQIADIGVPQYPFFQSFIEGARMTWDTLKMIVMGFIGFFSSLVTAPSAIKGVSGPIGIIALAYQATHLGIAYLIQLIALISLNLAVLNCIPFPALDGGRLLFLVIEKIKGSSFSLKTQTLVNGIGFGILITLMVVVSIYDITKLFH